MPMFNPYFRNRTTPIDGGVRTKFTNIIIEPGCRHEIPGYLQKHQAGRRYVIITDYTVAEKYGNQLLQELRDADLDAELIEFGPGEENKNVGTWNRLIGDMEKFDYGRNTVILAVGGGVVGDVAGFVAATYKRSVEYDNVATTLLAQVDSSLGGKTGVNSDSGKNLIGAFHQPSWDFVDPETLR